MGNRNRPGRTGLNELVFLHGPAGSSPWIRPQTWPDREGPNRTKPEGGVEQSWPERRRHFGWQLAYREVVGSKRQERGRRQETHAAPRCRRGRGTGSSPNCISGSVYMFVFIFWFLIVFVSTQNFCPVPRAHEQARRVRSMELEI